MYVIRRHSRELFFPAGLLALAWLPVLAGALLAARPELRRFRQRVLQVSMPPIQQHFFESEGKQISLMAEAYASSKQLATMHLWHTVYFTGNPWQDYLSARTATFVAQQLKTDPDHDRGLRVQFESHSQYRSLVAMLDMFQVVGLKKYWIDTRHEPTTLYSFTVPPKPNPCVDCVVVSFPLLGGCIQYTPPPVPAPPSWHNQLRAELAAAFRLSTWRPLFRPDWRYSTVLLLLLPLTAAWQLRRLRTLDFRR